MIILIPAILDLIFITKRLFNILILLLSLQIFKLKNALFLFMLEVFINDVTNLIIHNF